ncbi:ABC transporter ATP-binding protein [Acuticoccus sp. MNP-M23]|uniref:ABC transporter ATP-binding protein n=1 Tax=Acuticoccus sp. MNP-M23 TaxID=3072793 RepID=UPI00281540D9|nr:ABC transporter ATP-binding protein [Acuticoccus sp. MNP-M23]WMS42575.1 ABC transporter ATP-binding protein [Acuticoccus sp. MNP-M23]
MTTLLSIQNLETHFVARTLDNEIRTARALNRVSFDVARGEIVGLVGETGAGKSLTAQSVLGLLRAPARVVGGTAAFGGRDLLALPPGEMNTLRGNEIGLVVQNPRTSLDPLCQIGRQLVRIQRAHRTMSRRAAWTRGIEMLSAVGIPEPENRMKAWPHELSGGMAQRVLMAMALVNEPRLLIADEPTTGLDVTVQAQILDLLRKLVLERQMGAIIITHDLGVVAHYCEQLAVMFAGSIVERGRTADVFANPSHPYTRALLSATPERLRLGTGSIVGGAPPDLYNLPDGCHYRDRCKRETDLCRTAPPMAELGEGHGALCHFAQTLKGEPI